MFKKVISLVLSVVFSLQTCGFAQAGQFSLAGYLGQGGAAPALDRFRPASLRYFSYEPKSDNFQILLDKADEKGLSDIQVKDKADELMRYFRIGLSLPNDKFWVNLRPDAPEQIIDPALEQTDIGKIMLEADLQLKKDTSSLTSPQTKEGKEYWDKLYKKAGELFGSENITIPTITRPWIVPGEIIIRQSGNSGLTSLTTSAYIYKAALKVMLEEDHLKGSLTYDFKDPRMKELNGYSSQLIRELIIPQLTKEVNRAKRYAGLRQVYYSLILARWFKQSYHNSGATEHQGASATVNENNTLAKLIDSGNIDHLTSKEPWSKDTYYQGYKKSFEQGEYNLSETVHTPTGQVIRRYVSGGVSAGSALEVNNSFDVGKVNKDIPGVGDKGILLNYTSSGSKPVVIAASPLLKSLKDKAMGRLSTYIYDNDEYNAIHAEIYKTQSIAILKTVFDNKIRSFKVRNGIRDPEILDDFSYTLSALILIKEAKMTLEEEVQSIKNTYKTYASLSKKNQSEALIGLVDEFKKTERAMKDIARQLETKWSEIVSSPISQEMKELMKDIKQKSDELKLIFDSFNSSSQGQQRAFQEFKVLKDLSEALELLYKKLQIEINEFFDPKIVLAGKATEIGINRNLITKACKPSNKTEKRMEGGWSSVYPFSLSKEIFIAGTTYDRFYIEAGFGLDTIVLQRKGDGGYGAGDIRLYIGSDSLEVLISDHRIKEELQTRIMNGGTLNDIVDPIKEALVQASKSSSALTPKEKMTIELNKDIVLNEEKLERQIAMRGSHIDKSNKKLKKSLGERIGEDVLANIEGKIRVVSEVFVSITNLRILGITSMSQDLDLIAVPMEGVDSSVKYRIFLWNDSRGVILDFDIGEKISVSYASESFFEYYNDYDWHDLGTSIKDALGINGASSAITLQILSKSLSELMRRIGRLGITHTFRELDSKGDDINQFRNQWNLAREYRDIIADICKEINAKISSDLSSQTKQSLEDLLLKFQRLDKYLSIAIATTALDFSESEISSFLVSGLGRMEYDDQGEGWMLVKLQDHIRMTGFYREILIKQNFDERNRMRGYTVRLGQPEYYASNNLQVALTPVAIINFPYEGLISFSLSQGLEEYLISGKNAEETFEKELWKIREFLLSSSSLTNVPNDGLGAVDFRAMDMLIQPAGSFKGLDFSPVALSGQALEAMDLERDLEGINQMTLGRRRTHPQRLKEYISACIFKGKIDEKADDFILSMLEVFQLQAEEGIESSSQDREAVVLADTRGYALAEK